MKLSDHMRSPVTDARIERQWAAIEQGLDAAGSDAHGARVGGRSVRMLALLSALGLCATAGAAVLLLRVNDGRLLDQHAALPNGARIESAKAEIAVRLEDGSRVQLAPESQLRLLANDASAVELELAEGSAQFAVTHAGSQPGAQPGSQQPRRRFAVKVGAAEVRVIGTRFRLQRERETDGLRVTLRVQEGVVEVRRSDLSGDEPRRVRAGETWSALLPSGVPSPLSNGPSAQAPAPPQQPTQAPAVQPEPALEPQPRNAPALGPRTTAPTKASAPARTGNASELFGRANLARRAGRMQDAAVEYADLLERFPRDARAGLSAFELGRLRMDALADPRGAVEALERSIRGSHTASFHEDALARIVIAHDALGEHGSCKKARERYLARYPSGVHAIALAQRCM